MKWLFGEGEGREDGGRMEARPDERSTTEKDDMKLDSSSKSRPSKASKDVFTALEAPRQTDSQRTEGRTHPSLASSRLQRIQTSG